MPPFDAIFREHQAPIWKLAHKIAKGWGGRLILEDLVAAGNLALWRMHERYDPSRGTTLWQSAYLRVKGAMIDELRDQDLLSRRVREEMKSPEGALDKTPWAALYPVPMEAAE